MGRAPPPPSEAKRSGPWSPEEDRILIDYIQAHGHTSWSSLPKLAGLSRCSKSCRLRWRNYLRPDIKHGDFTPDEDRSIAQLHAMIGNRWSKIATHLPGRTDNDVKNRWNCFLRKRLRPPPPAYAVDEHGYGAGSGALTAADHHMVQWETARLEAEARLSAGHSLFSGAATASNTTCTATRAKKARQSVDFFLQMWNSEIGDAFRRCSPPVPAIKNEAPSTGDDHGWMWSPETSVAFLQCSSELPPVDKTDQQLIKNACDGPAAAAATGDYSSASNEFDEGMEACRLFFDDDYAGDEIGLAITGNLGCYSLFPVDVAGEASLG